MTAGANTIHDLGIATHIGKYSDAVEAGAGRRLLFLSGTPGLTPEGKLPETFEAQAEQAWRNVFRAIESAGMGANAGRKSSGFHAHGGQRAASFRLSDRNRGLRGGAGTSREMIG